MMSTVFGSCSAQRGAACVQTILAVLLTLFIISSFKPL